MANIDNSDRIHLKWGYLREYFNKIDTIDTETRGKAIKSLNFLEQEFGGKFLKTSSNKHPVRQLISNRTSFDIKRLIEFTNTLALLKTSNCNYEKLIGKLRSETLAKIEGVPFVEIAGMLLKEKLEASFVVETNEKTPDIRVVNVENGEMFFIEITILNDSEDHSIKSSNSCFFHEEFHYVQPQYSFYGKQKQIINIKEYPEIRQIIAGVKNKVREHGQIVYYSEKRFSFLLAPPPYDQNFNEICKENNIDSLRIEGLSLDFDQTPRINSKLKKAKQVSENYNGLLYISVSPLYFMTADIPAAIERLEANIAKYQNLLGIVLFTKIVSPKKETALRIGKHLFARRTIESFCYESLFIFNNNCDVRLSDETIQKIYRSLI